MDWPDLVQLAITAFGFVLMAVYVGREALARSKASRSPAVEARVVSVERSDSGSRMYRWYVETVFDVPGHGELRNRRGFETEGHAILWSRRYKEGSSHRVVPNALEGGGPAPRGLAHVGAGRSHGRAARLGVRGILGK